MAIQPLVTVGDYALPEPSFYTSNTATLVDSARNVEGRMIGAVIRDNVAKIEVGWRYLTAAQWARIQQCFDQSRGGRFINRVMFYDQNLGAWVSKDMYVGDRNAGMWRRDPETGQIMGFTDPKFSLIEV